MELKWAKAEDFALCSPGSNCTFMELKYKQNEHTSYQEMCSNCTFMELKSPPTALFNAEHR